MNDISTLEKNVQDVESIRKWAEEFMNYIFSQSQLNIVKNGSSDTGFMLRSGVPPYWEGNTIKIKYDAPQSVFIEYGTRPHMPPVSPLVDLVKYKLRIPEPKASKIALAIAMNIKKNGTEPSPFLRPAIYDGLRKYNLNARGGVD